MSVWKQTPKGCRAREVCWARTEGQAWTQTWKGLALGLVVITGPSNPGPAALLMGRHPPAARPALKRASDAPKKLAACFLGSFFSSTH